MNVFKKSKAIEAANTMEINLDLFHTHRLKKEHTFYIKKKGKFVVDEAFRTNHVHIL